MKPTRKGQRKTLAWEKKRKLTKHERSQLRAIRDEERGHVVWQPHPD